MSCCPEAGAAIVGGGTGPGPDPDIVAARTVMMTGDSIAVNLRGGNLFGLGHGVSRALIQNIPAPTVSTKIAAQYVGRFTDPLGYRHEAVGGRTLAQVAADFPAAWAANQADEVWVWGTGINDQIAGFTAVQIAANLQACIQAIRAETGPDVVIRVAGPPPINAGGDSILLAYNLLIENVCDVENANGPVEWMAGGFMLWTQANPPVVIAALDDGIVVEHPRDIGYAAMSVNTWQHLSRGNALPPNGVGGTLQMDFDWDNVVLVGANVSSIQDQSGFGRNATQAVDANRPTLTTLFGRPAGLFTGGTKFLRTAVTGSFANPTILAVVGQAGNNNGVIYDSANAVARNALFGSGAGNQLTLFAGASITIPVNPQLRPHFVLIHWQASGQRIFCMGEKREVVNAGTQLLDGMTIGAGVTGLLPFNGILGRFSVWTGSPDIYAINQWCKVNYPGIIAPFGE